jgi:pimeloyl-ACP methyl ester carboxylesterase
MSEASVIIDGVRSPLLEFGSPGLDEAVVFVHGNPGSSLDWERLARGVGEFGRAVAMDMPGFGAADKPPNFDYSVPGYARFLGRLLAERRVQRAHLVMHNFGGPWGLAWAAANPEAVASVTCINTGVLSGYRWHYLARIWQTPLLGELFNPSSPEYQRTISASGITPWPTIHRHTLPVRLSRGGCSFHRRDSRC